MAMRQDVNYQLIITVGLVSTILLFVVVVGLQAWFYYEQELEHERKSVRLPLVLTTAPGVTPESMRQYRWIDREQQVVGIPIDVAIDRVAQRYAQRQPQTQ
jgi:hypothetical protein